MERRYLAAALAMAATFAIVTHAFNSGMLARYHEQPNTVLSDLRCTAQTLTTRLLDRVNRSFGPRSAEEAQLRVELNLPAPASALPPVAPHRMKTLPQASLAHGASCPTRGVRTNVSLQNNIAEMQARLIAMQARLQSREMERAMTRASMQQARAARLQARLANLHSCRGIESPGRSSADNFDFDYERLSKQITEQVNRSLE